MTIAWLVLASDCLMRCFVWYVNRHLSPEKKKSFKEVVDLAHGLPEDE